MTIIPSLCHREQISGQAPAKLVRARAAPGYLGLPPISGESPSLHATKAPVYRRERERGSQRPLSPSLRQGSCPPMWVRPIASHQHPSGGSRARGRGLPGRVVAKAAAPGPRPPALQGPGLLQCCVARKGLRKVVRPRSGPPKADDLRRVTGGGRRCTGPHLHPGPAGPPPVTTAPNTVLVSDLLVGLPISLLLPSIGFNTKYKSHWREQGRSLDTVLPSEDTENPVIGPLLSRADAFFHFLGVIDEPCKLRAICEIVQRSSEFSPLSDYLSVLFRLVFVKRSL